MKKVAVVTGCNRGTGEGILKCLINNGFFVYGINKTSSDDFNKCFKEHVYQEIICDVSDSKQVQSACSKINEKVDLLVLNAGIRRFGDVSELSIEDFSNSIDVNLKGPFYVLKYLLDNVKNAKGTVVFVGSHAGRYPFATGSAYCSSKRGVEALAECLMEEVRKDGVKVHHLSLGAIKNRVHGYEEEWKIKPEEIGSLILNLLSMPENILLSDINVRPQTHKPLGINGIELMQYK